jgi:hypothetical protein
LRIYQETGNEEENDTADCIWDIVAGIHNQLFNRHNNNNHKWQTGYQPKWIYSGVFGTDYLGCGDGNINPISLPINCYDGDNLYCVYHVVLSFVSYGDIIIASNCLGWNCLACP